MSIAVVVLSETGELVGRRLAAALPDCEVQRNRRKGGLAELTRRLFATRQSLVFVMATGIVVRMIAPLLDSKYRDPAVVVVDDACRYALSLLSGHEGGANALAYRVAALLGAEPVITTGSETNRRLLLGLGCRRGVAAEAVRGAIERALALLEAAPADVRLAATVEAKREEEGLRLGCQTLGIPLLYIPHESINRYCGPFAPSEAAERHLGVRAVAEPCALLVGRRTELALERQVFGPVTVAVAREDAWQTA